MHTLTVGLFNDSFPPTIDGVANVIFNYARVIQEKYGHAIVATPYYPGVTDDYPFEVIRYPSADLSKRLGYRVGYPFSRTLIRTLEARKIDIIHTHCPFSATLLARLLRYRTGAPIILTYHTKFDIDIGKRIAYNPLRKVSVRFLLANINACDEIWVVSSGAGENLKKLGYQGSYHVMENGTDFMIGKSPKEDLAALAEKYDVPEGTPIFLYVGRMMWYKGIRLSVDALRIAKAQGADFRMFFVGEGYDRKEIMDYVHACGLDDCCIFTGAIYDRDDLKTYYSMANLFLFPSTYDTNGIVVREAAACQCPSLLISGSCAAEEITHERTGILTEENEESISIEILKACRDLKRLEGIGIEAAKKNVITWEDAVEQAYERYELILDDSTKMRTRIENVSVSSRRFKFLRNRFLRRRV